MLTPPDVQRIKEATDDSIVTGNGITLNSAELADMQQEEAALKIRKEREREAALRIVGWAASIRKDPRFSRAFPKSAELFDEMYKELKEVWNGE